MNASYAYRQDDPAGRSRADFMSVGISVDMPIFTRDSLDQEVRAARLGAQALETNKRLLIQTMLGQVSGLYQQRAGLQERRSRYRTAILPALRERAESALTAYTTDEGDFADVMRARIDQLNTELEYITLQFDTLKADAQLAYYFPQHLTLGAQGDDQ